MPVKESQEIGRSISVFATQFMTVYGSIVRVKITITLQRGSVRALMRTEIKVMSGLSSQSIAAIRYPGIEIVGIDKHQTFLANLMKLGLTV